MPGPLALLGHLGLRQPHLGADQLGQLVGEVVDERAQGRVRTAAGRGCTDRCSLMSSPVPNLGAAPSHGYPIPVSPSRTRTGGRRSVRADVDSATWQGSIREDDIAEVREKARIDDVVVPYVTLRNAGGGSMKGLCPFHDEKSPSFHVTPRAACTHCFGCQEGGDVINFVMETTGSRSSRPSRAWPTSTAYSCATRRAGAPRSGRADRPGRD